MSTAAANKRELNWINILFLTLSPVVAIVWLVFYMVRHGLHPMDIGLFLALYLFTGMGITAGYHRCFSHKSYEASPLLQLFYLLFGAAALQNSALRWCRDHRIHHQKVDAEEDPYNIMRGAFYAHMGWILYKSDQDEDFSKVPDLSRNPLVLWQDRHYLPIALGVGFGLPALIGWLVGRPVGGLLWGGLVRTVVVHHMTFCINSLAHLVGTRPYSLGNTARDSWWLGIITYGEGYHNFHHRFPADYRNGIRWYQFDLTKWWIRGMSLLGLAGRLTRYREEHILKARIETDVARVQGRLEAAPEELSARLHRRIDAARAQYETAVHHWQAAKASYHTMKASLAASSEEMRRHWKRRLHESSFQLQAAQARWALLIAALSRLPGGPAS